MKKIIALFMFVVMAVCFCSCGDDGMSQEEYEKFSSMKEELDQYHALDEYNILTEDEQADFYSSVAERYGEDVAEEVVDMFYDNTNKLYTHID